MRNPKESRPAEKIAVLVGLVVLIVVLLAFVWLFILGHGFDFPY